MNEEVLIRLFCQGAVFAMNLFFLWKGKDKEE